MPKFTGGVSRMALEEARTRLREGLDIRIVPAEAVLISREL